jgi:hypothetical protein
MTEKKQTFVINDRVLDRVTGGGASSTFGGDASPDEMFWCPKCGSVIPKETRKTLVSTGPYYVQAVEVTKCWCDKCGKSYDPGELKKSPDTYWYVNPKTF